MFAVIFEVKPRKERWDDYLDNAKLLKPELEQIDGFIDNERFASKRRPGWLLSLSTWRDEKAVIRWRTTALHHKVQLKGRTGIFEDYHLRVGEITADTHLPEGHALREERFDVTESGAAKQVTIVEKPLPQVTETTSAEALAAALGATEAAARVEWDAFESITAAGKFLLLQSWKDGAGTGAARPDARRRSVRIIRDYGMFDRHEAPQYYPAVARPSA